MKARVRAAGFAANDYVFGMIDTGHMDATRVGRYIAALPSGVSELYSHPATQLWPQADPADADYRGEFAALMDPGVIARLQQSGVQPITFTELASNGA